MLKLVKLNEKFIKLSHQETRITCYIVTSEEDNTLLSENEMRVVDKETPMNEMLDMLAEMAKSDRLYLESENMRDFAVYYKNDKGEVLTIIRGKSAREVMLHLHRYNKFFVNAYAYDLQYDVLWRIYGYNSGYRRIKNVDKYQHIVDRLKNLN